MTPAVCGETAPSVLSCFLPSSVVVKKVITCRRSLRSSSGRPCWSAKWKISPRVDSWFWLSPSTFDSRIGPKAEIVARTGTPIPPVPSDRNSTG